MRLISWNVNGLRACESKGFSETFKQLDADFFCLQETKMQAGQLDLQFEGYRSYWNYADKKGYSGTAIFTRHEPLSVAYGIGKDEHDHEGRVITLEMHDFYLVCCYTPNSQDGLKRLDYRMTWEDDFREYLLSLDLPHALSKAGHLFLVVVPFSGASEECRLAHRLLRHLPTPASPDCRRQNPHRHPRLRPLPRRTIAEISIFFVFHDLKSILQVPQCTFHVLQLTFHDLQLKI